MPKLLANQRRFDLRRWKDRYYTEVRRHMDDMGSRYLFLRNKEYLEQHADLNVSPKTMAQLLVEAFLTKAETDIDILPRIERRRAAVTIISLAEKYGINYHTMHAILLYQRYKKPPSKNARFTWEQVEAMRAEYRSFRPHRPRKPQA